MSLVDDIIAGVRDLTVAVASALPDPRTRISQLLELASTPFPADGSAAMAALCRRTALIELARATLDYDPPSYDDAVAVRDQVCDLIEAEQLIAADAFEDDVAAAFRSLMGAVARDLTARGASLSPMRTVTLGASLPALVIAQRLYGDAARADEVVAMAGQPPNPAFMPTTFRALAR